VIVAVRGGNASNEQSMCIIELTTKSGNLASTDIDEVELSDNALKTCSARLAPLAVTQEESFGKRAT
jgi:hypothetical protein